MKARAIAKAAQERGVYKLLKQYSVISCKTYRPDCADCQVALEARRNWGKRFHMLTSQINKWDEWELERDLWGRLFFEGDTSAYDDRPDMLTIALHDYNTQMGTSLTTADQMLSHHRMTKTKKELT